jgi:hypothetical protein
MKRFSKRRSVLALAIGSLVFSSLACDTMESDASKADRRVQKSVSESIDKSRSATTQASNTVLADLNQAVKEADASFTSKIQAKSMLAQAEFEAGDRDAREIARLQPDINRALWEIAQTASQIQKLNDSAKALEASNPQAILKSISDQQAQMTATGQAAAKRASELQTEIDKIKAQVATLTQQKDAAMTEADSTSDKASKASAKDAPALQDAATESRRKGENLGHEIDQQSAALLPLERDLAVEQARKTTADQGIAALDENKKSVQANWQTVQSQIQELGTVASKLGGELATQSKTLEDLMKKGADLRDQAAKHFDVATKQNAAAANDAKSLASELGAWSSNEKFSHSPERKTWDQLRTLYHLNIFKLNEAEAFNALGNLHSNQALLEDSRAKLAASITKTLQDAKITVPPVLAAPQDAKAAQAANDAYNQAASKFLDVYSVSGTPKDAQQAARIERIFSFYGQYLNGDAAKLGDAKKEYAGYKETLTDPKDDPLARWIPAPVRG